MVFPCRQIIRTIHGDTTTFDLPLNFVLAEQKELSRLLLDRHASSVRIYQFSLCIQPSGTRNDPFRGRCRRRQQQTAQDKLHRHAESLTRAIGGDVFILEAQDFILTAAGN
jgi:hypothetical protein